PAGASKGPPLGVRNRDHWDGRKGREHHLVLTTCLQVGRGSRIAACEQDNVMERNQFVGQPRNNALGASIKLRRNGLSQRGYLRDLHAIILSGNSTGLAELPLQSLASCADTEPDQKPRDHRATLAVMQRETDRGRRRKREISIPRSACSSPQAGARGARRLPSQSTRPALPQDSEVPLPMRGWDCSVSSFE